MRTKLEIIAYTDGSCYWKTLQGGFGAVIVSSDGRTKELSMGYNNTSVNRMELSAVLYVFKSMPKNREVDLTIYSDSEYVVKSFTEGRLIEWIDNDFRFAKNKDLWQELVEIVEARPYLDFNLIHVRGHKKSGDEDHIAGNDYADELADYKQFTWRKLDCYKDKEFKKLVEDGIIVL